MQDNRVQEQDPTVCGLSARICRAYIYIIPRIFRKNNSKKRTSRSVRELFEKYFPFSFGIKRMCTPPDGEDSVHNGRNQNMRFSHVGNGYYTITNAESGKALGGHRSTLFCIRLCRLGTCPKPYKGSFVYRGAFFACGLRGAQRLGNLLGFRCL